MATEEEPDPVAAAAKARAASLVGRVIADRYRIDELMAMGGMGAVYRGEHLRMRKRIAIKVLHPDVEGRPELVARFEREAIAGAQLSHPNVASATDFGDLDDGSTFLVLEYVAGQTLHDALRDGPMSPERAVHIARQLAVALAAVHGAGIVHRDVKPRNVMLVEGTDDLVKIIDFGLAKISEGALPTRAHDDRGQKAVGPLTGEGILLGTVAYLAPEAALGMGAVDARSDLYALGVILYQMLSGKHPFDAKEPSALFKQHRFDAPPPISVRAPGVVVPPGLEAIAIRLLAKAPPDRFTSGDAVVAALDDPSALAPPPEPVEPSSPPSIDVTPDTAPAVAPPARSFARPIAVSVALGAVAIALALFSRRAPPRAPAPSPSATTQRLEPAASAPSTASAPSLPAPAPSASVQEPEATSAATPAPPAVDVRVARATLVRATEVKDWTAAEAALLALADAEPAAFHAHDIAGAAGEVATALAREGDARADRVFAALGERCGSDGLDVLYTLVESRGQSQGAQRAAALLGRPEILARATPALRIAFELREAPCDRKLGLLARAESEGDGRALVVLETFGAPCFGRNKEVEAAIKALRERLNTPPAAP